MSSLADLLCNEPDIILYAPGESIFAAGDAADAMYVVIDGEVDVRLAATSLGVVRTGEVFGEMALVDQKPRSASVVALTATRLARIDRRRFLYLIQNTPTFAIDVMAIMASRIRRFDEQLEQS